MGMKHVLLEVYCDCILEEGNIQPSYCLNGVNNPGSYCFANECQFMSYCDSTNEIAYVDANGYVEDDAWIGFGGDMEPESNDENERSILIGKWKELCKKKINEAYEEYMIIKKF